MDFFVPKDLPCEKCPLQFGNKIVLNMHMKLVHKIDAKTANPIKMENETNMFSKETIYIDDSAQCPLANSNHLWYCSVNS